MHKPLTEEAKQRLRDNLEEAMSVADEGKKVLIAINIEGEGSIWQANFTIGELAIVSIGIFNRLTA